MSSDKTFLLACTTSFSNQYVWINSGSNWEYRCGTYQNDYWINTAGTQLIPLLPDVPKTVCAEWIPWTHEHTATRPHVSRPPAPERICLRACGAQEAGREGETGGVMKELWPSCGLQDSPGVCSFVNFPLFCFAAESVWAYSLIMHTCEAASPKKMWKDKKKKKRSLNFLYFFSFPFPLRIIFLEQEDASFIF